MYEIEIELIKELIEDVNKLSPNYLEMIEHIKRRLDVIIRQVFGDSSKYYEDYEKIDFPKYSQEIKYEQFHTTAIVSATRHVFTSLELAKPKNEMLYLLNTMKIDLESKERSNKKKSMQISSELTLTYDDFEIEIGQGKGRDYPISVLHSEAGEAHENMQFPYDELMLENRLLALQDALLGSGGMTRTFLTQEEQTVQNFGSDLFNALITGEVRNRYDVSMEKAKQKGRGLRVKLRIKPPNLAVLPWEFLYETRQAEYMGLMRSVSIVRYPEHPQPIQPLSVTLPLQILGMVANPTDLHRLDIDNEKQRVEEAIKNLQDNGFVKLTWLEGQTWRDLQKAMLGGPWHIFHFIGHGGFDNVRNEGIIALADEEGQVHRFSATELSRLLADHQPLRLVILNSCEGAMGSDRDLNSSTASILVRRGILAVLAMQHKITDRAAIEFSRTFYDTLAYGLPVDAAVAEARKAISIEVTNTVEWGTPVLYMRSPDGVLFNTQDAKRCRS